MKFQELSTFARLAAAILCCGTLLFTIPGCVGDSPEGAQVEADDHDHDHDHDHAEESATFESALSSVGQMKETICKAFKDETPGDAHDALHEVGHTLEKLPELAKAEGLTDEQLASVKSAVESLFDGFHKLDETMHDGDAVDIGELETSLSAAMETLEGAVKHDESE